MVALAKGLGSFLVIVGLSVALFAAVRVGRDDEYAKAALLLQRNPGNVLYEARHGAASIKRAFTIAVGAGGVLVFLNGVTLLIVAALGRRVPRPKAQAAN